MKSNILTTLSFEHKLQLLIYAWMYERSIIKMYCGPRKYRLFNMLSGETLELITDKMYLIDSVVELILKSKNWKSQLNSPIMNL